MGDRRTGEFSCIHIVDPDTDRRAKIVRQLQAQSIKTENYDCLTDFVRRGPASGFVLINADARTDNFEALVATIRSSAGFLPMALYSESPSPSSIVNAMLAGALDYLEWPFTSQTLGASVERLAVLGEEQARMEARKAVARRKVELLTPREREVLAHLLKGESNKGIARALGISPRTVEIHRGHAMMRLSATSTAEAVRIGLYAGIEDSNS